MIPEEITKRKMAIALDMVDYVKDSKRPYSDLKYYTQTRYGNNVWDSYFIAYNILRNNGVQNAKRKPLTNLTANERKCFRREAKVLAELLQSKIDKPMCVLKTPIKTSNGSPFITIEIKISTSERIYVHPTYEDIRKFSSLSQDGKILEAYRYFERIKYRVNKIQEVLGRDTEGDVL
jgi:hypothetical protein